MVQQFTREQVAKQLAVILEKFGQLSVLRQQLKRGFSDFQTTKRSSTLKVFATHLGQYCEFMEIDNLVQEYYEMIIHCPQMQMSNQDDAYFNELYASWFVLFSKFTDKIKKQIPTDFSAFKTFESVEEYSKKLNAQLPAFENDLAREAIQANTLLKKLTLARAA